MTANAPIKGYVYIRIPYTRQTLRKNKNKKP